jgi:hypothetical protein
MEAAFFQQQSGGPIPFKSNLARGTGGNPMTFFVLFKGLLKQIKLMIFGPT